MDEASVVDSRHSTSRSEASGPRLGGAFRSHNVAQVLVFSEDEQIIMG